MSAYKKIAVQVRNKIEPPEPKQIEIKIDEEQAIKDEQEYWSKSNKDWRFLNYQVFDYMWKRKLITMTKEQGDMVKARVKAMFMADKKHDYEIDEETMRQQCKKYSLMLKFNNEL